MVPILKVHPSWFDCAGLVTSDTWRWFHFEKWSQASALHGRERLPELHLDASTPSEYASILRAALWIVAEAIRRDGISREHLSAEDMRWARRCGLALLSEHLAVDGLRMATPAAARHENVWEVMWQVTRLFPDVDQPVLGLSLHAPASSPSSHAGGRSPAGDGPSTPFDALAKLPQQQVDAKVRMLVKLAKRHAAARLGVDLRESTGNLPSIDDQMRGDPFDTGLMEIDPDAAQISEPEWIGAMETTDGETHGAR